jgi:hypothetical protein
MHFATKISTKIGLDKTKIVFVLLKIFKQLINKAEQLSLSQMINI